MNTKNLVISGITVLALAGGTLTFGSDILATVTGQSAEAEAASLLASETTPIRPATDSDQVSAAGNIAVVSEQPVVFQVNGTIVDVSVEVGDFVSAGDVLVRLDTTDLERAAAQAELTLASSQAQLDKLLEQADPAEIASAQASLTSAQETLLDVQAGASSSELAAAEANLSATQQRYQDLLAGPSDSELTQLKADLEKLTIDLQQAQWNYDQVAYADDIGMRPEAAALQQATISYEASLASYEIAVEPAAAADVQDALSNIQTAQDQLETLRLQPTAADLASAEAQVASAASQLDTLLTGSSAADIRAAEISVELAQLDLTKAQDDFTQAILTAPIDGTVMAVDVSAGENITAGFSAVTLSNLNALELTVNVAEVDVRKVNLDQPAEITIDALPDVVFEGIVTEIAPSSSPDQGVVNYPVTVQLSADELAQVRPGMTAVATLQDDDTSAKWLVPTTALSEQNGRTVVTILRNGQPTQITVQSQGSQGEWTVVESTELQADDQAVGNVSTFVNEEETGGLGGGPGGGGGPFGRD